MNKKQRDLWWNQILNATFEEGPPVASFRLGEVVGRTSDGFRQSFDRSPGP